MVVFEMRWGFRGGWWTCDPVVCGGMGQVLARPGLRLCPVAPKDGWQVPGALMLDQPRDSRFPGRVRSFDRWTRGALLAWFRPCPNLERAGTPIRTPVERPCWENVMVDRSPCRPHCPPAVWP